MHECWLSISNPFDLLLILIEQMKLAQLQLLSEELEEMKKRTQPETTAAETQEE